MHISLTRPWDGAWVFAKVKGGDGRMGCQQKSWEFYEPNPKLAINLRMNGILSLHWGWWNVRLGCWGFHFSMEQIISRDNTFNSKPTSLQQKSVDHWLIQPIRHNLILDFNRLVYGCSKSHPWLFNGWWQIRWVPRIMVSTRYMAKLQLRLKLRTAALCATNATVDCNIKSISKWKWIMYMTYCSWDIRYTYVFFYKMWFLCFVTVFSVFLSQF